MRRHRFFPAPLVLSTALAIATSASAAWPPGGKLVSSPGDINGVRNARIMELPTGDLVVLGIGSAGNNNTYNVQRLTRDGFVKPGMPALGMNLSPVIKGTTPRAHGFALDDRERFWHSWATTNALLESVDRLGARSPASGSYFTGSSPGGPGRCAPAPGGEIYVTAGSNRLKRLDPSGQPAFGWTMMGVTLPAAGFQDNALLSDPNGGGVFVFMRASGSTGLPIALRFTGNGVVFTGWPAAGLVLSNVAVNLADVGPMDSQLLPSGQGHMLAVWSLDAGNGTRRMMMQRFSFNGALDPAWPVDGLEVVAPESLFACRAIADGTGGAYIVRQSHMKVVATHITFAGTVLGSADKNLLDPDAQYVPTLVGGAGTVNIPDDIIADVTDDGGLLVGWNDTRLSPQVSFRLRWLTPSLTSAPDKPAEPLVFFPASAHSYPGAFLALNADGPSGAFIAWSDYHDIGFSQISGDLWMTYVQGPTTVGVQPTARALSLSAPRPNPAIGSAAFDLVLPDDASARVELLDVAGRVLRTQLVEGAGPHAITFDALGSLAPGLYFARATSRDRSSAVRVVVGR